MVRYYSTQRPVMPGSYPKVEGNRVLEIQNFDTKTFCPEIGRSAWDYIEYAAPIPETIAYNYELVRA